VIYLADSLSFQNHKLISLISEQAKIAEFDTVLHFAQTCKTLEFYSYTRAEIPPLISGWQSLIADYIKSDDITGEIEKLTPESLLKPENNIQFSQYLSVVFADFKERYNSIIRETIPYDAKMCGVLYAGVSEKIDRLQKRLAGSASTQSACGGAAGEKFEKYHRAIRLNLESLENDLKEYFSTDDMTETFFKTDGDRKKIALSHKNLSADFKISAADAVNIFDRFIKDENVIGFSLKDTHYVAVRLCYDYPMIDYTNRSSLLVARITSFVPSERDLKFVRQAVKLFYIANERVVSEIEKIIGSIKVELLKKIALPHDTFKNIDGYFNSLFEILCVNCGAKYAFFICAGEMDESDSVKAYGFSDAHCGLLINRLAPVHSKIIKSACALLDDRKVVLINDPREKLKFLTSEISNFPEYAFNEALVAPLRQDESLRGLMIFFNGGGESLYPQSEIIIEAVSGYIINLLCNCLTCFKLKQESSDFKARLEEAVTSEKMKLLAAMSTGLAHNFNNLMAVILGRVGLLQRSITDEKALASLKVIEDTLKNGEDIVTRLQAFIPRKSVTSGFLLADINKLVAEVAEIAKMRIQAESYLKNITIDSSVNLAKLPQIFLNSDEIHEALLNIAFNAIEAMPHGGDISFASYLEGPNVCVSIKDTGVGMSREVQQKVFTPFFTTKGQIGTGLSLSYTYGVILKHKGNVVIKSTAGKGAEMIIKLPVNIEIAGAESPLKKIEKVEYKSRIIVVDDNKSIRDALSEIIKTLGHVPFAVSSGEEAFGLLKKSDKYDFIFTDYKMPAASGIDVAQYVKKNYPHMFVIIVTAYSQSLDEMDVEPGIVDAIIGKPFNISTIESTINAALDRKISNFNRG